MRLGAVADVSLVACVAAGCAAPASSSSPSASGAGDLVVTDAAAQDLTLMSDLRPAVCGNGDCEPGENGASCGSDCCDAMTSRNATRGNGGALYCRRMNGGPFGWYAQSDTLALCDDASEVGKTTFRGSGQATGRSGDQGKFTGDPEGQKIENSGLSF